MIKNNVVYAVIAAAGSGSRAKLNKNKLFAEIDGTPVLSKTVSVFDTCRMIDEIVIIYRKYSKFCKSSACHFACRF